MASPNTYDLLLAAIQDLAEDDSTEFLAYIPTAIGLAEDRLFRLVDYDFSTFTTAISTAASNAIISKPVDYRVTHNMYYLANNQRIRLVKKTEDYLRDYWPSTIETAPPKYYTDYTPTQWLIAPTPDAIYPLHIEYEFKPVALADDNQTNLFTDYFPDLLFYATMSNMCEWMKDVERKAEWEGKIQEALASTNREGERTRTDDATNANNPMGGRNTKVKNGT